jgi:hypothetical protein
VALVEHHAPVRNMLDPDFPGMRSGNPTSYKAIRGLTWLDVEYANGEKEYHRRRSGRAAQHLFRRCQATTRRRCTPRSRRFRTAIQKLRGGGPFRPQRRAAIEHDQA